MAKAKEKMEALVPVEEQPYPVPENWRWVRLEYLSDTISKGTTPPGGKSAYIEKGISFLRVENLNNNGSISHENMMYVDNNMHEGFLKRSILQKDDVLISIAGTLGKTGIVDYNDLPLNTNQAICFIRINGKMAMSRFIKLSLDNPSCQKSLLASTKVTAIPNLTLDIIRKCFVPLPPITEQKRIVDYIERLFAKLDEAKEKAQAVVDGYEDRKAAILHKAFTGELTEKWRNENSINIPWKFYRYAELGSSKLGKMLDAAKNQGKPVEYLRNINVRWFAFDLDDVSSMLATEEECSNLSITDGDLLICEGGEPGRCAVWHGKDNKMIFQKALHRFRPYEYVLSEFVGYNLYYMSITGELEKHFTGTTIKHLTGKSLAEIVFKIPSVEEQKAIVRNLDQFMDRENEIVSATKRVLDQIECLKKSILAKAFRGELGTNDPSEPAIDIN